MRDETILMLAGGALVVGLIIHRKLTADPDGGGSAWDLMEPVGPGTEYPGYPIPTPGPTPLAPGGATPPAAVTPAPTAAQQNAAFTASMEAGHAAQEADFQAQVAELRARVASGAVTAGSPYYNDTMAYLANLRGGVTHSAEEMQKLHNAGLAGGRGRGRLRLVR